MTPLFPKKLSFKFKNVIEVLSINKGVKILPVMEVSRIWLSFRIGMM